MKIITIIILIGHKLMILRLDQLIILNLCLLVALQQQKDSMELKMLEQLQMVIILVLNLMNH